MRLAKPCLLAAAAAALLLTACKADLQDGCLSGACPSTDAISGAGGKDGGMGGGDAGVPCGPLPATGDIPCDVFKVIHESCNHCHMDPIQLSAPFTIVSYEDTQMPYDEKRLRYQRMKEVIQPMGSPHMPFKNPNIVVPPLTDAQFKTLDGWLACPTPTADKMGCECPGNGCTPL